LLVFVVTILVFSLVHLMPGDPVTLIGGIRLSQEKADEIKAKWNLDQPLYKQYYLWLKNFLSGDFGVSIRTKQSVNTMIAQRIPYSINLIGLAILIQFSIAIPLGLLAAYKKDTLIDRSLIALSAILNAVPIFWVAIILILIFSVNLKLLPSSGYVGAKSLILPAVAIVLSGISGTLRLTKSEVLEVFREKHVATAYAKGLENRSVLAKHVMRNAMIPVTVMFFLTVPWMIGGEVIVENIFAIPGMGRLLWRGIATQDFPIIQACIFIIATLTVTFNILGDIVTAILDPRIREELESGGYS
jgi:ABC-type dipeptide/oligopeptide/nickel transport system permease component